MNLKESRGKGNEKRSCGPEESAESNHMSSVMADGQIGSQRIASGLNDGSEKSQGAETSRIGVQGSTDLFVDTR